MTVSEFRPEFRPATGGSGPATSESTDVPPGIPAGIPESRNGVGTARAGVIAGAVVSIAANVGHSLIRPADAGPEWHPQLGAAFGAVWWPISLYVALEVLVSPLWPRGRWWWVLRLLLTVPVAAVAAVVSYHHLSGLLLHWEEDPFTVRFGPIAVDGLMALCSLLLIRARHGGGEQLSTGEHGIEHPAEHAREQASSTEQAGSGEHLASMLASTDRAPLALLPSMPGEHPGEHAREHAEHRAPSTRPSTRRAPAKQPGKGKVPCDCGLPHCPGVVGVSTRTAHRRQVRESTGG